MPKRPLGINVYDAARQRISLIFDEFPKVAVSFSGGKDSTVLTHMVMDEAIKRERKVGLLFIDLEAQYTLTIQHIERCFQQYRQYIEPYWVALPLALRNAVSMYEPKWLCWDPDQQDKWVRNPPGMAITDEAWFAFFQCGMEFEEFVEAFGYWYSGDQLTACFVGIRADESLNRYRTLVADKTRFQEHQWTTYKGRTVYNAYPLYDWRTEDIWTYTGKFQKSYNPLYDLMNQAGLSIHQQRICQPYGDDQRKGLWLYHLIEPETWGKVVARVNGANSGAIYAQESGNILGRIKIHKPDGHTWESYAKMLLESLPPRSQEQFRDKITVFLKWWYDRGYPEGIPDEADHKAEASKSVPSWRRICKALLRNDWWCKGLSFSMTRSDTYERYRKIMEKRRRKWGLQW
jgi:predicted phosphoadenosine phosphosulfate sulfurtransferase